MIDEKKINPSNGMSLDIVYNENCLTGLKNIPDNSVDCCVTSPPYFGLRNYEHDYQIGLESTPELFVLKLVQVFTEVKRVLKPTGTLWLNLGDSYASAKKDRTEQQVSSKSGLKGGLSTQIQSRTQQSKIVDYFKPKDLLGIPWRVAFALQQPVLTCKACNKPNHYMIWGKFPNGRMICPFCNLSRGYTSENGWYLRQDIIWHKPNPMPESVTDRCTKSHEYIFLLSKSPKYYYDYKSIMVEAKKPVR